MVRYSILASGSKGNSAVLTAGNTRILVDAGLSCRELFKRMRQVGEDPEKLSAIVITHEHTDHINGLAVTARRLGIPVFWTEMTHRAWVRQLTPKRRITYAQWIEEQRRLKAAAATATIAITDPEDESISSDLNEADLTNDAANESFDAEAEAIQELDALCHISAAEATETAATTNPKTNSPQEDAKKHPAWLPHVEYFKPGEAFEIGTVRVSPFTIPHDAADPVGYVFESEGIRIGVATDLGYVTPNVKAELTNLDLLVMESNHDLEMLREGPYPWSVKQRVLSRVGHLSNDATGDFLEKEYDGRARYIVLAHLSECNNLPDLARMAAERALGRFPELFGNRLLIAAQHQPLDPLNF